MRIIEELEDVEGRHRARGAGGADLVEPASAGVVLREEQAEVTDEIGSWGALLRAEVGHVVGIGEEGSFGVAASRRLARPVVGDGLEELRLRVARCFAVLRALYTEVDEG